MTKELSLMTVAEATAMIAANTRNLIVLLVRHE